MRDNKPQISVIVPIYNVEKYIRECLDTLKNQTMKQIEIICIDDGSADKSGKIADEYESDGWPRFRIIHTENRGLSAVRNRGIDEAKTDWIMFVDSDDWVGPEFCRIPYEAALMHDCDLVIFGSQRVTEKGRRKRKNEGLDTGEVDFELAIDNGLPAVWNKLYRKSLFENIHYPERYVYEDVATTHKVVYKASRIYQCQEVLYYYRIRNNSISQTLANDRYNLEMSKIRCKDLIEFGYPAEKAKAQLYGVALRCYGRGNKTVTRQSIELLNEIRGIPVGFSTKEVIMLNLWRANKSLYRLAFKFYLRFRTAWG